MNKFTRNFACHECAYRGVREDLLIRHMNKMHLYSITSFVNIPDKLWPNTTVDARMAQKINEIIDYLQAKEDKSA